MEQGLLEADACERMRENVRSGVFLFTAEHYKQMWSSRLELRDNVWDNTAAALDCSAVADAASASAAAVVADKELPGPAIRLNVMDEVPTYS